MRVLAGDGVSLPATLDVPEGRPRAGLVPLHPAEAPGRDHYLLAHLAAELPRIGMAVLRFDRRPAVPGRDVPLGDQASDAAQAVETLRAVLGEPDLPVGLWGFSQGAWAAMLAAADPRTAFLVTVSASGVSPAEQMRYGTAEQLRRAGYGPEPVAALQRLRRTYEGYLRGDAGYAALDSELTAARGEPWFGLSWVPDEPPAPGSWPDMDFDPTAAMREVACPVLAFYGERDEWVPIDRSIAAWEASGADVMIVQLPGAGHDPMASRSEIAPLYSLELARWLDRRVSRGSRASR